MIVRQRTGFQACTHGFPFPNHFPPNSPIIQLPSPWGPIPIGDAHYGLCGGMVFAALDFYLQGTPIPTSPTPAVIRYLGQRLLASWSFPFGVLKYYDWQCRPGASRFLADVRVREGVRRQMILQEWPAIRADLDLGLPVPLGLVNVQGYNPRLLPRHHQVLAQGYDYHHATGEVTLWVYDPNYPNDECTLQFNLNDPDQAQLVCHSWEGPQVRGLFRVMYRKPDQMPSLSDRR